VRLIGIEAKTDRDPVDYLSVTGGLIIKAANVGEEASLKKLKAGVKFYPFINEDGEISPTGGSLGVEPKGNEITNLTAFKSGASNVYSIVGKNTLLGTSAQQQMHKETLLLKASRIKPPYLEIKKVVQGQYDLGGGDFIPYVYISGKFNRVRDPRLDYLARSESTKFGKGKFELDDIKATWFGGFVSTKVSPYAKHIESIVDEQIEAFEHYAELYTKLDADPKEKQMWASKYEHTRRLLKPHANEIYKYANGFLYYINTGGNWQIEDASGYRSLDLDDRVRIHRFLEQKHGGQDLREQRETLWEKALHDRFKLDHVAAAMQPEVLSSIKKDLEEYEKRKARFASLRPSDGPLGTNDLPGLKKGITLFPHQSVCLAALRDRNRLPVDADPGAGKTLMIICDILQQMAQGKVKRPLILVPESLLPQFAQEIRTFSEMNPWIISTEAIQKWTKDGDITKFLDTAKRTPHNTIFLTSYNWISLNYDLIPNGEISEKDGKIGYRKNKVYSRANLLLRALGIDALYQDECFLGNSRVLMEDGRLVSIATLVNTKSNEKVIAYSQTEEKFVAKRITGHVRNLRIEPWWELEFLFGKKLTCTPNHEFYTPDGLVRADSLKEGDSVLAYLGESEMGLVPCTVTYSGISRASSLENENFVYCLEVEDEHNFICEGKLVANCHMLKGTSGQAKAAKCLASVPTVRGFTGTMMPGNPFDVTGPLSVIHSSVFGTSEDFKKDFTAKGSINEYKKTAPKDIRNRLKDFGMPSVRKSAWAHLLPKIHRQTHFAEFTEEQKKTYTALLTNIFDDIRKDPKLSKMLEKLEAALESGEEISAGPLLTRFAPLDIFLNHPAGAKSWTKALMHGVNAISPKAKVINQIIKHHFSNPEAGKVLVFVQFKDAAKNLLEQLDPSLKHEAAYYEGGMNTVLTRFKDPQDPLRILFAVDKTIVVGHNMQAANCLIHADLRWLPGDMEQRDARAARLGQKRDVYIHTILVRGSAEILKQAKNISAEHIITKANSDFDDQHVIQPVKMSLANMESFDEHKLKPFLARKTEMDADIQKQSEKARDFYGPTMMTPHGYSSIHTVFKNSKVLTKVPSAKDFNGDLRNPEALIEKDLEELPSDPKHPKRLLFGLSQKDHTWFIYSYKSADPEGFLRRLGFNLERGYYYVEMASKSAVHNLVERLEKDLDIVNKDEFEFSVRELNPTAHGIKEGLRKEAQKARSITAAGEEKKKGEVSLEFSLMNGVPVVWVHNVLTANDPEYSILKRAGFTEEPAFWLKEVTRSSLKRFFSQLLSNYPQVRLAKWDEFKGIAHKVFMGLNLDEFDSIAEKK
jgi:SNF2 family DNA or RNA helicase